MVRKQREEFTVSNSCVYYSGRN